MGRIKNEELYILDQTVSGNDRIIGSDGDDLKRTKNFSIDAILAYFNSQLGSAQDLQSVLGIGDIATTVDGFGYIEFNLAEGGSTSMDWYTTQGAYFSEYHFDAAIQRMRTTLNSNTGILRTNNGLVDLQQTGATGQTVVDFTNPIATTTLKFPAKTAGTYTIATTADIVTPSLDAILEADLGTGFSKNSSYIAFDSTFSQILINDGNPAGQNQEFFIGAGDLYLQHTIGTSLSKVNLNLGNLVLSEKNATGTTDVAFTEAIANTTLNFPAKTAGTYTLATTTDCSLQAVTDIGASTTNSIDIENATGNFDVHNVAFSIGSYLGINEVGGGQAYAGCYTPNGDGYFRTTLTESEAIVIYQGTPDRRLSMIATASNVVVEFLTNVGQSITVQPTISAGTFTQTLQAATGTIALKDIGYTVATLPVSPTIGDRAYVTDATAPTYLGTLTGGGAVVCPVFYNGSAWVSA